MHLTQHEAKLIEKLRKQNRQWHRTRWLVFAVGVLSSILCIGWGYFVYLLTFASGSDAPDSSDVFVIVLLWTKCCIWFCIAASSFVTVCTKWHGDVNRVLLLKLLDAQQKQTRTDEPNS